MPQGGDDLKRFIAEHWPLTNAQFRWLRAEADAPHLTPAAEADER